MRYGHPRLSSHEDWAEFRAIWEELAEGQGTSPEALWEQYFAVFRAVNTLQDKGPSAAGHALMQAVIADWRSKTQGTAGDDDDGADGDDD